ncbi:MAG: 2-phospho-L-lactate guanylyltransferase [Candidatus Thiodiazotropha sp.]|nr:2-phospho-L-lactate guanylyltransferase [Candidatus Thiodiazotropha sp.]MCM8884636.1 2-phospho-L-lactate guanylyltransferase [Candidatus Thiodiazotropha sp.]
MNEIWALVPLKELAQVKNRLAPVLTAELRRELVLAMAQDVVSALLDVDLITRVLLVTNESSVAHLFSTMGVDNFRPEQGGGLNTELEQAVDYATVQGARQILIVHADLPLLTPLVLGEFIAAASPDITRAAACKTSAGTNLLLTESPLRFPLVFGSNSLRAFRKMFIRQGRTLDVVKHPQLAMDIDTPDDLHNLLHQSEAGYPVGTATRKFLVRREIDLINDAETGRWKFIGTN